MIFPISVWENTFFAEMAMPSSLSVFQMPPGHPKLHFNEAVAPHML
jgi:hypothetical protein